jgi:uncharacterized protein
LPAQLDGLVAYVAKALVDRPELVELKSSDVEGGQIYELKVAAEDIGKVIGRDGRTINALRTVLAAAALRKGQKVRLEILDDRRGPAVGAGPEAPPPESPPQ